MTPKILPDMTTTAATEADVDTQMKVYWRSLRRRWLDENNTKDGRVVKNVRNERAR